MVPLDSNYNNKKKYGGGGRQQVVVVVYCLTKIISRASATAGRNLGKKKKSDKKLHYFFVSTPLGWRCSLSLDKGEERIVPPVHTRKTPRATRPSILKLQRGD